MKKAVAISVVALGMMSFSAFAEQMTGYISDSHCGKAHNKVSDANTACIKKCTGAGSDPVLVSDGNVMKFDADSKAQALAHIGEEVKIDGTVNGDVVKVSSIDKQ
ncbi:MAG: hypothetical protein ACJ746_17045 [Bryobacteraceae bacterium]